MPSDQSTWLVSVPQDGDSEGLLQELLPKLTSQAKLSSGNISSLGIPSFKTGTLDSLVGISEDLPKQEAYFTATVAKTVDTLRNLLNNDPAKLSQHILIDERAIDDYLFHNWRWNESRYNVQKSLRDLIDTLNREIVSIDGTMKAKLNNYNLVKGSLTQMQRKQMGNLSTRSLGDVVSSKDFIEDSEYLETVLVAVPRNLTKEWNASYERLTQMVVPRSSKLIKSDDEFSLFGVVIFKRVHDEFIQKCRDHKFIVRDFVYSEEEIEKQKEDHENANKTEKELWTELLRISRTNFSEAFQILVHLKVVRLFVESVLRYGLPANYAGLIVKPDSKSTKKVFHVLQSQFAYLRPRSNPSQNKRKQGGDEEYVGEYSSLMEQEFFDFVLFEIPWIV
ncbi:hypothetical protein AGABI1DRAFT_81175 [Agaricus bisporus var. burnettii JB137-S8]|uniref:V-type proton ATPase subunit C n=1 Tax=Agaricus bisporus var. burnettii (strain JB137-S8 / ATCC MYA-4627 / FGSC 10392) TaxID=597362 RepID=K5XJ77_AGABU|nr:uncharacterized protein AGABI1DRAFT_81175 [Agaricus bisporus var. burnettii JB137-S8]EKM83402.1 hypothetical protein AGABI1DRAFT_81175 [Agaricus bisporus var. burnettii JB137-S8]